MEKSVYGKIKDIEIYKHPKDIRDVRIIIGQYRLEALKYHGPVRKIIFKQADKIERALNCALKTEK